MRKSVGLSRTLRPCLRSRHIPPASPAGRPPAGVCLIALSTRISSTCCSRSGSASTNGVAPSPTTASWASRSEERRHGLLTAAEQATVDFVEQAAGEREQTFHNYAFHRTRGSGLARAHEPDHGWGTLKWPGNRWAMLLAEADDAQGAQ